MFELRGRVAVVTGGASGIGRETALLFASAGAGVAVWDVRAVDDMAFWRVDVTSRSDIERATRETVERFGRIDVLINNAGPARRAAGEDARGRLRRGHRIESQRGLQLHAGGRAGDGEARPS